MAEVRLDPLHRATNWHTEEMEYFRSHVTTDATTGGNLILDDPKATGAAATSMATPNMAWVGGTDRYVTISAPGIYEIFIKLDQINASGNPKLTVYDVEGTAAIAESIFAGAAAQKTNSVLCHWVVTQAMIDADENKVQFKCSTQTANDTGADHQVIIRRIATIADDGS